jgi:hypothetical protein
MQATVSQELVKKTQRDMAYVLVAMLNAESESFPRSDIMLAFGMDKARADRAEICLVGFEAVVLTATTIRLTDSGRERARILDVAMRPCAVA